MKKILVLILPFIFLAFLTPPEDIRSREFRAKYAMNDIQVPLEGIKNLDCAIECGGLLYVETRLGMSGMQGSCAATCHVPTNHLAPQGNQIGTGGYFNHRGERVSCEFMAKDLIVDDSAINTPQAENVRYREKVLHDGSQTPQSQINQNVGGFAHNLFWQNIVGNEMYEQYFYDIFEERGITEEKFEKVILSYQHSFISDGTRFQSYCIDNKHRRSKKFMDGLELKKTFCMKCHNKKDLGGGGLTSGPVVRTDTSDLSILRSEIVLTRSEYNPDAFDSYGWLGEIEDYETFIEMHIKQYIELGLIHPEAEKHIQQITKWNMKNLVH